MKWQSERISEIEWNLILSTEEKVDFASNGEIDEFVWEELMSQEKNSSIAKECFVITECEWTCLLAKEYFDNDIQLEYEVESIKVKINACFNTIQYYLLKPQ